VLEELSDVLGREKFNRFVTSVERDEFLETFVEQAILVEVIEKVRECRDPKDDKILELAYSNILAAIQDVRGQMRVEPSSEPVKACYPPVIGFDT
jgi:putative PIN family toxin of toxin-antitoxin system